MVLTVAQSTKSAGDKSTFCDMAALPSDLALGEPWTFLHPTAELCNTVQASVSFYLDSLALSISDSQSARQRRNRKRKRTDDNQSVESHALQLRQLYVKGFTYDQVWQQAVRIFDSTTTEIERDYYTRYLEPPAQRHVTQGLSPSCSHGSAPQNVSSDLSDSVDQQQNEDGSLSADDNEPVAKNSHPHSNPHSDTEGSDHGLSDEESTPSEIEDDGGNGGTYLEDAFGLNDGFFSIDEFNKQSEHFERQDARDEPAEDTNSDDEEIDWHTNPFGFEGLELDRKKSSARAARADDGNVSMDDSEDEGPTFDNMDIHESPDSDEEGPYVPSGVTSWVNTSDIKYDDFFAPPPRRASKKQSRSLPKMQLTDDISDGDIDRAMADVRRDLFEDEIEDDEDEDDVPDNARESRIHFSSHEKQRARIADEIRRLEQANVAKKEWMVSGEARAIERPVNSLIEEDLDFERIGKPVPVVTAELTSSIEDLVKQRILAKQFDEVIRRRPGVIDKTSTERSKVELEDTKPQQSLAELYEADHLRSSDPSYVDPKKQKLMREHTTVTSLWEEISSQLDTLSNWHYKPKSPQASISVVTDVATITMEDAQPATINGVSGLAALAPQEIYAPGDDGRVSGELNLTNGVSIAKEEMTREQKAKLRRERKKQKHGPTASKQQSGKAAEAQKLISDLKKGGVKVIGKQGEFTDIQGNRLGEAAKDRSHSLKL
ncbi:rRNA-processing protein MPP10 [Aspergillus saccharolyticus JOP 1030-1]|uniref:U3 small nucleolar ribonucleoprotein protein MPP10 n=1 Tax=Aspergillus saccharolyticus JOP 1030-1 TaxID=1450539 RepID=A0A318ZAQ5_9EURO|nr:Mpp10 protein [Aspergillus saccharolyticus JOP 1030-1]PYH41793.1 Mpp10 protein [Aspergillus saccharolyticus JOP 1030-1]